MPDRKDERDKPPSQLSETIDLLKRYVLQETVGPLKGIGRVLLFGLAGAFLLGIGLVILALALLRVLQGETGRTFAGHWNFAPYLLTMAGTIIVLVLVIAVAAKGASRGKARRTPGDGAGDARVAP